MESNRYALAGWLAIAQGALFPVALGLQFAAGVIGAAAFKYRGPIFSPADILFIAVTAMSVYTLWKLKELLNERYNFHGLDVWLPVAIGFGILFQVASVALRAFIISIWPVPQEPLTVIYVGFMIFFMVTAGIIDIIIGAILLKSKGTFSGRIDVYAYIVLACGIAEFTVILVPLVGFLLFPISQVVMAMVFFDRQEVEFV